LDVRDIENLERLLLLEKALLQENANVNSQFYLRICHSLHIQRVLVLGLHHLIYWFDCPLPAYFSSERERRDELFEGFVADAAEMKVS